MLGLFRFFTGRRPVCAILAGLIIAVGAVSAQTPFEWQYSTPEEQGVDSRALARLCAQLQRDRVNLHGLVLIRHDRIIAEAYVYPYTAATRHTMYSVSKSFTSSLVGIAIGQGLISSVDEHVADIFSGVTDRALAPNMSRMTLRHLLTMASGHAADTTNRITSTTNWERTFMELPVEDEPGSRFVYNSGASYMLAAAVQLKVGMTARAFADRYLFGPLGITDYTWDSSPSGIVCGGWGLSLRPLDMARFGLMYLHHGRWQGVQVVPENWVSEASRPQMNNGTSGFWGSGYGYQFWINDFGGFRADGAFAQYIFILPEHDLVAVFTNNLSSDTELPGRLLRQYVLPALAATPLPENPRGEALLSRVAGVVGAAPGGASSPTFLQLPEAQSVSAGEPATFTVTVAGAPAPFCQWYKDELPIAGATATTLRLPQVTAADAGEYAVVLRNATGATASYPVTLTVLAAPRILRSPASLAVGAGGTAVFSVQAAGDGLGYEWQRNGVLVPNATSDSLIVANATAADAGTFTVTVHNDRGRVVSEPARLTVGAPDQSARLMNLSVRARAGSGDNTLIVGLVIAGGGDGNALPVLLRGIGPSLRPLQLPDALADPAIVLYERGTPVASNADWRGATVLAGAMERAGAFAISHRSADAVLHAALRPRAYTMHVISSLPDRSGVALAECYDASGVTTVGAPRLVNVSARSQVGTGDDELIAGFVVDGTGRQRVLIRGIGPALGPQGVSGTLADPELQLFSRSVPIAANDEWGGAAELRAAFAQTGAFELPADSRDAALVAELPAGVYSAHVRGKAGATGVAMVEVYALP